MNEQKIKGVPVGTKVVELRRVRLGDCVIDNHGLPVMLTSSDAIRSLGGIIIAILGADNAYSTISLHTMPIPTDLGWERISDDPTVYFQDINNGAENWLGLDGRVHGIGGSCSPGCISCVRNGADPRRIILRRSKRKKKYLVMDRILVTSDDCITPHGALSEGNVQALIQRINGFNNVPLRIEEVEE